MSRRRALLSTTAVLSVGLAGCSALSTGSSDDPPTLPDGLSVETRHWRACVLKGTPICDPDFQQAYNAVVPDRESACNRLTEEARAETETVGFIEETDFSQSYLLLVQYRMQKAPRLALDAIERTDAGLRVDVAVESPDGSYGDVSVPHTLLIRITDERGTASGTITVSVVEEGDRMAHAGTVTRSE